MFRRTGSWPPDAALTLHFMKAPFSKYFHSSRQFRSPSREAIHKYYPKDLGNEGKHSSAEKAVKHFAQLDVAVLTKSMDPGDARFLRVIWCCEVTQDPCTDERTQET